MPIPSFNPDGLLPPGEHACSVEDVRAVLGFNLTRMGLVHSLTQLLLTLPDTNSITHILADGSFVQNVADPSDIDLVLVVDSIQDGTPGQLLLRWVSQRHLDVKARLGCDVYVADPELVNSYWLGFFGKTRDGRAKGLLRVVL